MTSPLKDVLRAVLPPILTRWLGRLRPGGCTWSGDYGSWSEAVAASTGYDAAVILERVKAAALKVRSGQAAWERDGVVFDEIVHAWPVVAALLWAAVRDGGRLSVLDFGGALGTSYVQNRAFLGEVDVRWSIVEQEHFVRAGRETPVDERLRFYESLDECLTEQSPNVLLLASVLQYLEHPYELLERARPFPVVVIDRTPMHDGEADRLTVQTVPPSIYSARYPCWLFSEKRVREALEPEFEIVARFDSYLGEEIRVGSVMASPRGLIARRRDARVLSASPDQRSRSWPRP